MEEKKEVNQKSAFDKSSALSRDLTLNHYREQAKSLKNLRDLR